MNLQELLNQGKQALDIVSNPTKAGIAGGAAAGAFAAETSTLRKDLLGRYQAFQTQINGFGSSVGGSISSLLGGAGDKGGTGSAPARSALLTWGPLALAAIAIVLMLRRRG